VYIAVTHRAREIAEALIEHGCSPDVGALGEYGRDYATYNIGGNLTDQCCPLHWPRERCKTPLIAAAESGNLEMVKMLLKHGAYAPTQDEFHRNAIDAASKPEIAQYIRANTTAQFAAQQLFDTIGNNSVSPAQGVALVARIAQTEPAAFRVRNPRGFTPLTYPLRLSHEMMNSGPWDHIDSVAFAAFHKCGIKLTGLDVYGMTPLHDAVLHARVSDVINLLKLGFDPSVPDIRGITALDLAKGIIDDARRSAVLEALHSHY
jgi:ankyrin repeat protein